MKVSVAQLSTGILFSFAPEEHDPLADRFAAFASKEALIETTVRLETLHPDIVGIIALFIVGEFSGSITLDREVSVQFASAATQYRLGKPFGPASIEVLPRSRPARPRPGLSFSGGVDSYAALQLMPNDTECFFLSSIREKDGRVHPKYSASGSRSCRYIRSLGRVAIALRSDLEFIRSKIGLPDHLACAVPLLVYADKRSIGSITFGSIAEAAFRTGSTTYTELDARHAYRKIHDIFDAVGIPVHNVVVGLSEVVTSKIVSSGPYAGRAQSCMWGGEKPCGTCIKCVRKSLLEMAVRDSWASPCEVQAILSSSGARKALSSVPMKLENVYAYIAWKCPHNDPFTTIWKRRVRADRFDMSWMERVFPSSLNYMVNDLRPGAVAKLSQYAAFMTEDDLHNARSYDLRDVEKDVEAMAAQPIFLHGIAS